jgi:hypothetical protein
VRYRHHHAEHRGDDRQDKQRNDEQEQPELLDLRPLGLVAPAPLDGLHPAAAAVLPLGRVVRGFGARFRTRACA